MIVTLSHILRFLNEINRNETIFENELIFKQKKLTQKASISRTD